jgi:hypothetical protein
MSKKYQIVQKVDFKKISTPLAFDNRSSNIRDSGMKMLDGNSVAFTHRSNNANYLLDENGI